MCYRPESSARRGIRIPTRDTIVSGRTLRDGMGQGGTQNDLPTSLSHAMAARSPEMIESSGEVQIALHDLGGPRSKTEVPVLLFSHATGFHGRVFEPMASFLNDRFRCVSLDLRGHGMSELPSGASLAWSGMADDVLAALSADRFPIGPLHGIGHSMGGAALVLAAARRPEAFHSLWLYEPVIVPPESGLLPGSENPMSEAAARRRDRFDSLDQAYENYGSKPPLHQLHTEALRAYVDGGFSSSPDGTVMLRAGRPLKQRLSPRLDERSVGEYRGVRDAGGRRCRTSRRGWPGRLRVGHRRRAHAGHAH